MVYPYSSREIPRFTCATAPGIIRGKEREWMPRGFRTSWLLCSLSIMAGCVQGPNYVKPAVAVPSSYRFAGQQPAPIPPRIEGAWWKRFGDKHLDALVDQSLANNRDLMIATARVDEFAAILAGTRSQAYP